MLVKTVAVLGGLAAAFLPPSLAEVRTTSYETSMTTPELEAFREVSRQCQSDVERLCDPTVPFSFPSPFLRMDTHPMLRGMMMTAPPPPPPPPPTLLRLDHDLGSFIDNFMMSAFHQMPFADDEDSNGGNFVLIMSTADTDNSEPCDHQVSQQQDDHMDFSFAHEDRLVHHVLRQFVSPETTQEEAEQVLERVSDHAQLWVEHPDASAPQRRMARRLTEVSADDIRMAKDYSATPREESFLPFTPAHNLCLHKAFHHNVVHPTCRAAMARLENVRASQHMMLVYKKEAEQTMLSHLALLYFFVIATAIVILIRRSKDIRTTRRLRLQVLQAIYSKPHLKRAVESELGESIGSVPPLQWPALMHIGLHGKSFGRLLRLARLVRISVLTVMCVLLFVAPASVLPFCITLAAGLFWSALWAPKPVRMCCCCSCGLSTEDAKAGLATSEQACCACCSGTGCCSVHCDQCCCCGPSDEKQDDGGCCKNDCCTPSNSDNNNKCCTLETGYVKMEDNVDGCCCCGADGDCCGGTECGCCCCCMSTCSCDPDKCCCATHTKKNKSRPVMAAKAAVYEGIPVQIV